MRNRAILLQMHVEPLLPEVLGHHLARLDDAALLGEIFLAEVLADVGPGHACQPPLRNTRKRIGKEQEARGEGREAGSGSTE